jgi:phenylalanyl-tRNA synthetase alpha chain
MAQQHYTGSIPNQIKQISSDCIAAMAAASSLQGLEAIRVEFMGRSGHIALLMGILKELSTEEKREFGPQINALKELLLFQYEERKRVLEDLAHAAAAQKTATFDVTAYAPGQLRGSIHPYSKTIAEIEDIFISMGFEIVDGPELETDFYNFEALNIPADHPARDMHDTFWLPKPHHLLRTHTSSVQVRALKNRKPPLAIAAPGRCFRHEATDASHDYIFMQCEGLIVGESISLANLFAVTQTFLQRFFATEDLAIRQRPGYFPFVEPGIEIDMSCPFCTEGCSTCKHSRWIEICGTGLVHPQVLRACGIDPDRYTGCAFGFGLTRLVMLKYGIRDIRLLHEGRIEFLEQF